MSLEYGFLLIRNRVAGDPAGFLCLLEKNHRSIGIEKIKIRNTRPSADVVKPILILPK